MNTNMTPIRECFVSSWSETAVMCSWLPVNEVFRFVFCKAVSLHFGFGSTFISLSLPGFVKWSTTCSASDITADLRSLSYFLSQSELNLNQFIPKLTCISRKLSLLKFTGWLKSSMLKTHQQNITQWPFGSNKTCFSSISWKSSRETPHWYQEDRPGLSHSEGPGLPGPGLSSLYFAGFKHAL